MFDTVIRGGTVADGTGAALQEADVAISAGRIAAIGKTLGPGREEIAAKGLLVTPGFVDVHTHYDGQAIWSEELSPSSGHGVTTAVMGNCGVGFAPCRKQDREVLIQVMEGVEDIPGVVMAEGLPWDWETFPQYLDRLDAGRRDIDVAAYLPHSPLRVFAMGQRGAACEPATEQDLATMRMLCRQAMQAGALGFATSRLSIHKTSAGEAIPTFEASMAELKAICAGMADVGRGTFQIVLDAYKGWDNEYAVIEEVVKSCGRPATFTLAAGNDSPPRWRKVLAMMERSQAQGRQMMAQVMPRPIGLIGGLELSVHPFILCPSWQRIAHLSVAQKVAALHEPALREALLSETPEEGHPFNRLGRNWLWMYPLSDPPDYAPPAHASFAAQAASRGCRPEEVYYDYLLQTQGKGLVLVALANYEGGKLDAAHEMLVHPGCVPALGDGGAHYGAICDASYSTFLLRHYARGGALGIVPEAAVHMLTAKAAKAVGLHGRGVLQVGAKADCNVIDLANLQLHLPEVVHDLPSGGRRLHQRASGYVATLVAGEVIRRHDQATGARPGRLVRGNG